MQENMALFTKPVEELDHLMEENVATLLLSKIKEQGDKTAFIEAGTGRALRYDDFYRLLRQVAYNLYTTHGLRKGDVILMIGDSSGEFLCTMLSAMLIGVTVTTGSPAYTFGEFKTHVEESGAKYILVSQNSVEKIKDFTTDMSNIEIIFIIGNSKNCISYDSLSKGNATDADIDGITCNARDHVAVMLCSSGTTGRSKLVMHSHYTLQYDLLRHGKHTLGYHAKVGHPTVMLWLLPVYNGWGFISMLWTFFTGSTVVVMKSYDLSLLQKSAKLYKVNLVAVSVPILMELVRNNDIEASDFDEVESFVYAGSVISSSVMENFSNKFSKQKKINVYGTSETFTISATTLDTDQHTKTDSVGQLYYGLSVRVVDVSAGKDLSFGEPGELLISGKNISLGYHKRPDANASTFTEDGWCRTGDMGYVDSDGFIYIVDRLKELIKVGVYQVSPTEIEGILLGHPKIRDCAVIGMQHDVLIEVPHAVVVLKPGETATEKEIQQYVEGFVQPKKHLNGGVQFVESIPKSSMGKTLRRIIRDEMKQSITKATNQDTMADLNKFA